MTGNTPDRKLLKQVNGIESRVGSALLGTDLSAEEVSGLPVKRLGEITTEAAMLIVACIRGLEPGQQANELVRNPDGSISLVKAARGRTDEEIVSGRKAKSWGYINSAIRSERRIEVPGKPEIEIGALRTMTIKNVVPSGKAWKFQKAVQTIGNTALAFDFEELDDLLDYRDKLLAMGVRYIVASAARFRHGNGNECVVYANLESRKLYLYWVEHDWSDYDWFGSSKSL